MPTPGRKKLKIMLDTNILPIARALEALGAVPLGLVRQIAEELAELAAKGIVLPDLPTGPVVG